MAASIGTVSFQVQNAMPLSAQEYQFYLEYKKILGMSPTGC